MKKEYGHNFYADRHQTTVYSARTILSIALDVLPEVHSAIDFGCGVGTWLSVLKEKGVREIQGLDGPWVDQTLLEIPKDNFREIDFEEVARSGGEIDLDNKYDFAMSLEVAEHLTETSADSFVNSLTAASDLILFSAAIPFQGGRGHLNEQWPDYWANLFAKRDFVTLDFLRGKIWNDKQIPAWYRQNILMFVRRGEMQRVKVSNLDGNHSNAPMALVHPDTYLSIATQTSSVKSTWTLFHKAVKTWFGKKLGRVR